MSVIIFFIVLQEENYKHAVMYFALKFEELLDSSFFKVEGNLQWLK